MSGTRSAYGAARRPLAETVTRGDYDMTEERNPDMNMPREGETSMPGDQGQGGQGGGMPGDQAQGGQGNTESE